MIWLRRARMRHVGLLWKLWALLFAVLIVGIFVAAASKPTRAMYVQHAPAEWQIAYWRAAVALALAEHVPYITAEIPTLPPLIRVHADLSWAALYYVGKVPCCTGDDGHGGGDCTRLPAESAAPLGVGSTIPVTYPNGRQVVTTVNVIYPTSDEHGAYVICAPGCLFKPAGV